MSSSTEVFDKIIVGQVDTAFLDISSRLFPGCTVLNGAVYIGLTGAIGVPRATCMIGPPLGLGIPASLEVTGIANFISVTNQIGVSNRLGLANIFGFTSKIGASLKAAFSATTGVSAKAALQKTDGPKICSAFASTPLLRADVGRFGTCQADRGVFASVAAPFKQFDIPHPTKEGYRLIHTCLEGPEIGVYYRGKLKGSNYIELPEYWRGLVDIETISVNLTPCGTYQELYYEISDWGTKIKVLNNSGSSIDCSYIIYAERKDVDKLVTEVEDHNNVNIN